MASRKQNPKTEDPGGYGKCLVRVSESDKEPKLSREARRRWGGGACAHVQACRQENQRTSKQLSNASRHVGRKVGQKAGQRHGYRDIALHTGRGRLGLRRKALAWSVR